MNYLNLTKHTHTAEMHQCSEVRALHTLPLCVVWRREPPHDKNEDSCLFIAHTHAPMHLNHTHTTLPTIPPCCITGAVVVQHGRRVTHCRAVFHSSPLHEILSSTLLLVCLSVCARVSLSLSHTHILLFSHGAAHIRPLTQKPGRASEREGEREQGKLEEEEIKG